MPELTVTASNRNRLARNHPASELFIKSVQWQTYKNFELLIADGGSNNFDDIKKWLETYNGEIPMRIVRYNIGEAFERARLNNVGIRNATGKYVMTTDVDMMFAPNFIEELMMNVGENILVESRTMYWKDPLARQIYSGKIDPKKNINKCKVGRIKKRTSAGGCQCMHKKMWEKLRGFEEKMLQWGSEDYDLLNRASMAGIKIKWIGESLENIKLFHQPHIKENIFKDLEAQEKNKIIMADNLNNRRYSVNENGWGGI